MIVASIALAERQPWTRLLESHPHPQNSTGLLCFFPPTLSYMKFRTESLRMTLWMGLTKRKRPPSFFRMLTEYPGQICSLRRGEKMPDGARVKTGAACTALPEGPGSHPARQGALKTQRIYFPAGCQLSANNP